MSETLQFNLPEDEKKVPDDDDDVLSTDAKAAALATSALRMAEEAKRAAELLAEVKASLRESRSHPEKPSSRQSSKSVGTENGDGTDVDEIPFLGDTYEKSADSEHSSEDGDEQKDTEDEAGASDIENIVSHQFQYQRFDSSNENDFDGFDSKEDTEEVVPYESDLYDEKICETATEKTSNVADVITQQPTEEIVFDKSEQTYDDDADAESNPSIETEDWPDDEGGENESARKAAIAEVSRRLAEIEARQEAVAAAAVSPQKEDLASETETTNEQTADDQPDPAAITTTGDDEENKEEIVDTTERSVLASSTEAITEEIQEIAETVPSIDVVVSEAEVEEKDKETKVTATEEAPSAEPASGLSGDIQDAVSLSVPEPTQNETNERDLIQEVTDNQADREANDNIVATDDSPGVVNTTVTADVSSDACDEARGCVALSEEILAEEMQEVSDALAAFGLGAKKKDENKVEVIEEPKEATPPASLNENREVTEEVTAEVGDKPDESAAMNVESLEDKPDKDDKQAAATPAGHEAVADVAEEAKVCLALSNEIVAEELQEVSEALVALGLVGKTDAEQTEPVEETKETLNEASPDAIEKDEENGDLTTEPPSSTDIVPVDEPEQSNVQPPDGTGNNDAKEAPVVPQADVDVSAEAEACIALSGEILAEEIQEVSGALASLGVMTKAQDQKGGPVKDSSELEAQEDSIVADKDNVEVTTSVSAPSGATGCMPGGLQDVKDALNAIGINLDSKNERDLGVEGPESLGNKDANETVADEASACVQLSAEIVTEEIQEVSVALASLGLTPKTDEGKNESLDDTKDSVAPLALVVKEEPAADGALDKSEAKAASDEDDVVAPSQPVEEVVTKQPGDKAEESKASASSSSIVAGCLSGGFDDVTEALSAIGLQRGFNTEPNTPADPATSPSALEPEVKACVALSEEIIAEEIEEVSTTLASLGLVVKNNDEKKAEASDKPDDTTASNAKAITCLSEEMSEVSTVLISAGLLSRKDNTTDESVSPRGDAQTSEAAEKLPGDPPLPKTLKVEGFDEVVTEAHSCVMLSEEMFVEELQEVSEAISSLASGTASDRKNSETAPTSPGQPLATASATSETLVEPSAQPTDDTTASLVVPRERSLADEDDKPEVDDIKENRTCIELSEQVSATMASFGLGSSPAAEQHPKVPEAKPNGATGDEVKSQGEVTESKDKANMSNDMLVESMAADRANCGCIVM